MEEKRTKTALQKAVDYLYNNKKIDKDKDVVEKTGYKKSTVSIYLKGTQKASPDFINKFEEVFNIRVSDFEEDEFSEMTTNHPEASYGSETGRKDIDKMLEMAKSFSDSIRVLSKTMTDQNEIMKRQLQIIERLVNKDADQSNPAAASM